MSYDNIIVKSIVEIRKIREKETIILITYLFVSKYSRCKNNSTRKSIEKVMTLIGLRTMRMKHNGDYIS